MKNPDEGRRIKQERLDFMSLVDTDSFNSGILNSDGTPRLTAVAVATMIRILPTPRLAGGLCERGSEIDAGEEELRAESPETANVLMAWRAVGDQPLRLDWPHPMARLVGMSGHETLVEVRNHTIEIPIGIEPVYILAP